MSKAVVYDSEIKLINKIPKTRIYELFLSISSWSYFSAVNFAQVSMEMRVMAIK